MADSLEPPTRQELEAKLRDLSKEIKLIERTEEVLERQDVFHRLSEVRTLLEEVSLSDQERQKLVDEKEKLKNHPVYRAWCKHDLRLMEFENQQRDVKEKLERVIAAEAPPSPPLPEISLAEALNLEPPASTKEGDSLDPPTKQALEAKLEELATKIKLIERTEEVLERQDVFHRLSEVRTLLEEVSLSDQERQKLADEKEKLKNHPVYLAWCKHDLRLMEFENQQSDATENLERVIAAEAPPSPPLPEISLAEALNLEPPASTATEDKSLHPATKQELEAKVRDLSREIKLIERAQKVLERQDVYHRLKGICALFDKRDVSGQEMEKLLGEGMELENHPLYLAWRSYDLRLKEFKNQQQNVMDDLERLIAAEAPFSPALPEISLEEALRLEPPAASTAAEGDSLEPATKQELEARLQELARKVKLIKRTQEVLERQDAFHRLNEIWVLLENYSWHLSGGDQERQKLVDEEKKLMNHPVYLAWRKHDVRLWDFESQQRDTKEKLEKIIAAEGPPSPPLPEISLSEALRRKPPAASTAKEGDSLEPATKQELEAKLEEAEREIKFIKYIQEVLEREAQDVLNRLSTLNLLLVKGRVSAEERQNLFDELHQLKNDPNYISWCSYDAQLTEFANQRRNAKQGLERLNEAEAVPGPSLPKVSLSLAETLKQKLISWWPELQEKEKNT